KALDRRLVRLAHVDQNDAAVLKPLGDLLRRQIAHAVTRLTRHYPSPEHAFATAQLASAARGIKRHFAGFWFEHDLCSDGHLLLMPRLHRARMQGRAFTPSP